MSHSSKEILDNSKETVDNSNECFDNSEQIIDKDIFDMFQKIYLIFSKKYLTTWSRATIPKKQSSAFDPSGPQSKLTFRSAPAWNKIFLLMWKYLRQLYSVCSSSLCLDMVLLPNMYLIAKRKIPFHYYLFWRKNSQNTLMMIIAIIIIIGLTVHTLQIIIIIVITIRLNKQTLQIT